MIVCFPMLGATTPFGYQIWDAMGRFGSRMLFLKMPKPSSNTDEIMSNFCGDKGHFEKKVICADAVQSFITNLLAIERRV